MHRRSLLLAGVLAMAGCDRTPTAADEPGLTFLRGGVLAPSGSGGREVGGGLEFLEQAWEPGAEVVIGAARGIAPVQPECVPLFSVDLGDVDSLVSRGVSTPGTSITWSPDGTQLAIGSYVGEVLVVDGWTGEVRARRKLAETMVKRVVWSADGGIVYAAEQSPDAFVHALNATDLTPRWSFRLADDLESSPPPPATDVYGVFTLPAAYGLEVLDGGDLLVLGMHAWTVGDDQKRNLARVWRLSASGAVIAAFPADGPADATMRFPQIDAEAGLVAFPIGRTASGPPPSGLPIDGVQVLNLADLTPAFSTIPSPLPPHFTRASMWEALDVSGSAGQLLAGYGDGRLLLTPLDGSPTKTLDLGTPMVSGGVPVAASVSWGTFFPRGGFAASTGRSNIPWGSDVAASRPTMAHPGENTLWVYGTDGELAWNWQAEPAIQGLSVSPDGRRLLVGGGPRGSDLRRDLFGAFVLRLDGDGSGQDRIEASCGTDAPVFFGHALTNDGRAAVSEVPFKDETGGRVLGEYQVTVLR